MFTTREKFAVVKSLFSSVIPRVYADEVEESDDSEATIRDSYNFEELITKARKEVKDQLYPQIEKLKDTNKSQMVSLNDKILENARLAKELEEMKNSQENNQEVIELKKQLEEAQKSYEQLKESIPNEEKIREQIAGEYEVKLYREQKLREHEKDILPVLTKLVVGSTKEEIDEALEAVRAETLETKIQLGLVDEEGKPVVPTAPTAPSKPKPPAVNPSTISVGNNQKFTADQIRNMSTSEFEKFRKETNMFRD